MYDSCVGWLDNAPGCHYKDGHAVRLKFYIHVLKIFLNISNLTKMVQSGPTLAVTANFLSNSIKASCGASSVRSDAPAGRSWKAAGQHTLLGTFPTNWSRCFWMIEENNMVISNSSLWRKWHRIILHKSAKSHS